MKKLLSIFLTICLMISLLPMSIFSTIANAASESDLTFTLNDDGMSYSVTDCDVDASGELTIPATYNGMPITIIGGSAFQYCTGLTNVIIPDSVDSIGYTAFWGCSGLTSITIPNSVTSIGNYAFEACSSLTDIFVSVNNPNYSNDAQGILYNKDKTTLIQAPGAIENCAIPDSVTSIGDRAFRYCHNLTCVAIGSGVTSIGSLAFGDCDGLTSVTIPDRITSIDDDAFFDCSGITSFSVSANNSHYSNDTQGILYNKDKTTLIQAPGAIETCIIPNSVTRIDECAFCYCRNLTSVTIPDSVTSIGYEGFLGCFELKDVWYMGTEAQREAISISGWNSDLIDATWHYNGCQAHTYSYVCDDTCNVCGYVRIAGEHMYDDKNDLFCNLCDDMIDFTWSLDGTTLTISGDGKMPDYDSWGDNVAPWGTDITEVIINDGIKSIGNSAFYSCDSLESITIPEGVTTIGNSAFYSCYGLAKVCLPKSIAIIGEWAFGYGVQEVWYSGTEAEREVIYIADGNNGLTNVTWHYNSCQTHTYCHVCDDTCDVCGYVRVAVAHIYDNEEDLICNVCGDTASFVWSLEGTVLTIRGKGKIPDYDSWGDNVAPWGTDITEVIINDGIKSIGANAFYRCSELQKVSIPNSVTTIGAWAFYFSGLRSVTLPDNLTTIGERAFAHCSSLSSINIPKSVTSIGGEAFFGCGFKSIFVPKNVTSIGPSAFSNNDRLTNMVVAGENPVYHSAGNCIIETESKTLVAGCKTSVIPDDGSVTAIDDSAFSDCINLKNLTIPEGVISIGRYAFRYCTGLENIMLPNTIEFIGWYAFDECPRLKKIGLPKGITTIEQSAFANSGVQEVWYGGNENDKEALEIEGNNDSLINATWHYNACLSHNYAYACDTSCEACGFTRIVENHTYKNEDDLTCDVCNETLEFAWSVDGTVLTIRGLGNIPNYDPSWEYAAQEAPWGTDITTVIIKEGIKSIGDYAFYGFNSIPVIYIPESVTNISESACGYSCLIIAPKNSYAHEYANDNGFSFIDADDSSKLIESIEIDDVTIMEGDSGYTSDGQWRYSIGVSSTVTFKDGSTQELGMHESIEINGNYYSVSDNAWELQNAESWEAGKTYTVTGTLLGVSDTFNVTIVESPIESMVIEDIVLYQGIDSYDYGDGEFYSVYLTLSSVLLKNGEYADVEGRTIIYDGAWYGVSDNSHEMQNEERWEVGGTYTVTGRMLGVSATFQVTVKENPIREIELITMPEKTEYLDDEYFSLKGTTVRLWYRDNSYEDIVVNDTFSGPYGESIWSPKLNKYGWIEQPYVFDVGQTMAEVSFFGKTCEIPITVKENLMESISIRENTDKSIIITVNNSDGTSYDMTILDLWATDSGSYRVYTLLTDKGLFDAAFYCSEGSFAIEMGELYSENGIKSNSLSGSEWYQAVRNFEKFYSSILPGNDNFLDFNGQVTEDNIDRIIGTAFYMGYEYWDAEDIIWDGDYIIITGERIRNSLAKYFALDNVDLTLSESYDAHTDTYKFIDYIRSGWAKRRPTRISYNDGIWSMKLTYLNDAGVEKSTYLQLDDEQKILSYRVNATQKAGDLNEDGEVTDADALYLLYHTIFEDTYPIDQDCDYNNDEQVTDADALYLLYHTIFGDTYPLN